MFTLLFTLVGIVTAVGCVTVAAVAAYDTFTR